MPFRQVMTGHRQPVMDFIWFHDRVVSGDREGRLRRWSAADGIASPRQSLKSETMLNTFGFKSKASDAKKPHTHLLFKSVRVHSRVPPSMYAPSDKIYTTTQFSV